MRRLCFGGSFNPVHHGHLICARAVAEAAGFDRVVLIPSAQPPHRAREADMAPAGDRLAMCRLAAELDPRWFEVSDVELGRSGPSYTIDTARQLRRMGWDEVCWLIVGDTVGQLLSWHQPEALLAEVGFVVMARPGWEIDWDTLSALLRPLRERVYTAPLIDISATEVRQRAGAGRSIGFLTPPPVAAYIEQRGLYAG